MNEVMRDLHRKMDGWMGNAVCLRRKSGWEGWKSTGVSHGGSARGAMTVIRAGSVPTGMATIGLRTVGLTG